jgi:Skp family chaperone for outer membrane proteins
MSDIRDDFRATVENVTQDAKEIENEKAELDPADPRARSLSSQAEELADELHRKTLVQRDLTDTPAESA